MTGQEIIDAWEKWIATMNKTYMISHDTEIWLRRAFLSGIEAAESIWREIPGAKVEQ